MNEQMIKDIAEWCVSVGSFNTMSGNYIIEYSDIASRFNVDVKDIHEARFLIRDEIDSYECILSQTWIYEDTDEEAFNMNFCTEE